MHATANTYGQVIFEINLIRWQLPIRTLQIERLPSDGAYKSSYIWDLSEIFSSLLSMHEYSYNALIIAIQF